MRQAFFPAAALAVLTFCSPDNNGRSGETGMAGQGAGGLDSTGASAETASPAAILSQLYVANTTEIQLSKLAAKKAKSAKVRQVANKLAADHAKNREEAQALAQKLNLTLTPAAGGQTTTADSAALPPVLEDKNGSDFDETFLEYEIEEHEADIERIQDQLLPAAQNPELKAYLQKTLTAIQGHLDALKQVQQQLG